MLERIRELCNERGLSFYAVEKMCGLGNGTIKRWGTQYPSVDKVEKIAKTLNVSIDYLVNGGEDYSDAEKAMIVLFRSLSDQAKKEVMSFARFKQQELRDFTSSETLQVSQSGDKKPEGVNPEKNA